MTADTRPVLRLGHSPDPDDAFMWWPLAELDGKPSALDTGRFRYELVDRDIEALNRLAPSGELEITAMSCACYPHVQDRYAITACGASMGDAYGPKLVARTPMTLDDLRGDDVVLAVPGEHTSALATTKLILGNGAFRYEVVPFETIIDRVASGDFLAGLIIHEGQLTYGDAGLHLVLDVGAWWTGTHELPLPLGVNTIRRDLDALHGEGTLQEVTSTLLRSVEYAMDHREASIEYALQFARGMSAALADEFVELYVNAWTLDFGTRGREAVRRFLGLAAEAGITPDPGPVDFIAPAATAS